MQINTRNETELSHFEELSNTWWDEKGPFKVLHDITPLRVHYIKEKALIHFRRSDKTSRPLEGLRILDVGCGGGLLAEPLARLGADVTGIDAVMENINIAQKHSHLMRLPITYSPDAIEDLPASLPPFDLVIASEIIEHVENQKSFLKACVDRLSPKGALVVTTFNKTIASYLLGIVMAENILNWAPKGTHSWRKFISPETLSETLRTLGLSQQDIVGLNYLPFSRQWTLSSFTKINYFLWAGYKI